MRLTLVGIGSPFGADTLGWTAARHLAAALAGSTSIGIETRLTGNPAAELPALLASASHALLLDALAPDRASDNGIHAVRPITLDELAHWQDTSSHGIGVGTTLRLMDTLGTLPACWALIGIPVGRAGWRDELTRVATTILQAWEPTGP
jgi:Ni,Fe-hydrogenase maturation factor